MSENTETPKRKKPAKPKAAKPAADRHRPEFNDPIPVTTADIMEAVTTMDDTDLSEHHRAVTDLIASRREKARAELEAKAATIGATVKWPGTRKGETVPVKYRDAEGNTWAGRGVRPVWLRTAIENGAQLDDFLV